MLELQSSRLNVSGIHMDPKDHKKIKKQGSRNPKYRKFYASRRDNMEFNNFINTDEMVKAIGSEIATGHFIHTQLATSGTNLTVA